MMPNGSQRIVSNAKAAENQASGREVDALGRVRAGHAASANMEEEEQTWSDIEDRSNTKVVWRLVPPDDKRCRAIYKSANSPWVGNQCVAWAIHGGTVCINHGGKLPNVKKAAQRRLAMAALPAADRLVYMALKKPKMSDKDRLRALAMILDRAGVEGKSTLEIEVKPWQEALKALMDRVNGAEGRPVETSGELEEGVDYDIEGTAWEEQDDDG